MLNIQSREWFKKGIDMKKVNHGCLCCGGTSESLPLDTIMYDGFGGWVVTMDGKVVSIPKEYEEAEPLQFYEDMAQKEDPEFEKEWLATVYLPLRGATYQRHGKNQWTLIESNEGFA